MLRRTRLAQILANIVARKTPNPDCMQFRPIAPLEGVLPPGCPPCDVPFRSLATMHPLADVLFENYEKEIRSVFLAEEYVAVTKWADVRWSDALEQSLSGMIGSFLMTNDTLAPDRSELDGSDLNGLRVDPEADSEVLHCVKELLQKEVRPMVQRDGGDIRLMAFDEPPAGAGVVRLKMLGACRSCPSSQNTLKDGIERMLRHFVPEVSEVVEFKTEHDAMLDDMSRDRLAAAGAGATSANGDGDDASSSAAALPSADQKPSQSQPQSQHTVAASGHTVVARAPSWNIRGTKSDNDDQMLKAEIEKQLKNVHRHNQFEGLTADDLAASRAREVEIERRIEAEAKANAQRMEQLRVQREVRKRRQKLDGFDEEPEG